MPKKQIKRLAPRHSVGINLTEEEHRRFVADLIQLREAIGLDVKPGTYAKHAVLSAGAHRRAIAMIRSLIADARRSREHGEIHADNIEAALVELSR